MISSETKDEFYYLFCSAYAKLKSGKKLEGAELYIIKKYFELAREEGWSQRRIADFWQTNVMKVNRILCYFYLSIVYIITHAFYINFKAYKVYVIS